MSAAILGGRSEVGDLDNHWREKGIQHYIHCAHGPGRLGDSSCLSKLHHSRPGHRWCGGCVRIVRLVHAILHRAFEKAVTDDKLLTRNPASHNPVPRSSHAEMQVLDETQVNQFLMAAIGSPFEAFYHLEVKTGMR